MFHPKAPHQRLQSFQTSALVKPPVDGRITEQRGALHPTLIKALNLNPAPTRHRTISFLGHSTTACQQVRWARAVLRSSQPGVCQEALASKGKTGWLPAIPIEALSGWRSRDLNMAELLTAEHTTVIIFHWKCFIGLLDRSRICQEGWSHHTEREEIYFFRTGGNSNDCSNG